MQNVDINKEVRNAMMAAPKQPRGIIDLLASELKAQDAQAKNKIRAMMAGAPPQDTILEQNEREAENSVRQDIAQKMQSMAVKERQNQARMNRALQGIAAQAAPNIRMVDGGIVGYQSGGDVKTPPKPTMGAVPPSTVGDEQIKQYAEEYMGIKKALENPENAQYKERNQMLMQDLIRQMGNQMPAVMQYIDSMKGIVEPRGFQEGGGIFGPMGVFGPSARRVGTFAEFLASKGIDTLSDVSEAVGRQLMQEFIEQKSAGDRRTELAEMAGAPGSEGARQAQPEIPERPYTPTGRPSVASSQMENLAGVARGGANLLREGVASAPSSSALFEGIASLAPEPRGRNRTELADMGDAPGASGAPAARREPSEPELAAVRTAQKNPLEGLEYYDPAEGAEALKRGAAETRAISVDEPEEGFLGQVSRLFRPSSAQRAANRAEDAERQRQRDILAEPGLAQRFVDYATRPLGELEYYDPYAPRQTDEEIAQEIIDTGVTEEQYRAATAPAAQPAPAVQPAPVGRTLTREEIDAGSALAREAEAGGTEAARRGASYLAGRGGETAVADLASTVAQDPTPENMNRFEGEIQRLMERRESPMRALSSFLTAFSQARGGSMGQNLAIATTAMNAADDALDKQIIELEKLRRADEISERDYQLKTQQVEYERNYRDAMAEYYRRLPEVQKEVEQLRQAGQLEEAKMVARREAIKLVAPNMALYPLLAKSELGRNATTEEIERRTQAIMEQQIQMFTNAALGTQSSDAEIDALVEQYRSR
jgi:hypothetical protein